MRAKPIPIAITYLIGVPSESAPVAEDLGQERRAFQRQRKGGWERALLAKALVEQAGMTQRQAAGLWT